MKLWPHQKAAIRIANQAVKRGKTAGLWSMPTGTGKTVAFTSFARDFLGGRARTLIMVHRDELIRQTEKTLSNVWGDVKIGVIQQKRDEWDNKEQVVIASVQSLHSKRLHKIPAGRFNLIIVDEAHHAAAPTWTRIIKRFDLYTEFILGCTATPERADGEGLSDIFGDEPLYVYPLRKAIEDGHLCRLTQYAIETGTSLKGVKTRGGDFIESQLSKTVNTDRRNDIVVKAWLKLADSSYTSRRTLVFCVDIKHVVDLTEKFLNHCVPAEIITGETPRVERRLLLKRFRKGKIPVICNCAVLTEGFDSKGIECIVMARPTQSRSLYTQCIGRGLRLKKNKENCLVLDFTDNSRKHKLITCMSLLGAPEGDNAEGHDVIERADIERKKQEELEEILTSEPLSWRSREICPWPELPTLAGYVEFAPWHEDSATDKQIRYLVTFGLDVDRDLTKGEASWLINRSMEYEEEYPTPATPAQEMFLRCHHEWEDDIGKREASRLIGDIKGD